MRKPKNKTSRTAFALYGIGLLGAIYLAIVLTPFLHGNLIESMGRLALMRPKDFLYLKIESNTKNMIFFFAGMYLLFLTLYLVGVKNYRRGEEHGSAKWGDVHRIRRRYRQKENLILTQTMRLGLNARKHRRNLNVLVIGGSGSGKTMFYARPNLMEANTAYIVLDPKGELTEDFGGYLSEKGYTIWVLDLRNPEQSDRYNPFVFLETEDDVERLVNNLFDNTTDKRAQKGEQIWDDAAKDLLKALIFYLLSEAPPEQRNFNEVTILLRQAETREDEFGNSIWSPLDQKMLALEEKEAAAGRNPEDHTALRYYKQYRSGATRTKQSVLFTLHARLGKFNQKSMIRLTSGNDLDLKRMGKEKIALFAVIPDDDKSYNFIVGMLYTQLFQQLYRTADRYRGKRLPVPVHFLMDEFANVVLPDNFESLLSTMRQRQIFCSILLQNLSQLKALYEKQWESIVGNCDSFLYLGGNEQSTHKYVSELLGKETIDTDTHGKTKGRMGGYSTNYQNAGRELLQPDEVRMLDNDYAIYFLRGERPVLERKYDMFHHPNFSQIALGGAPPYVHTNARTASAAALSAEQTAEPQDTTAVWHAFFAEHTAKTGEIVFDLDDLPVPVDSNYTFISTFDA